MRPGTQKGSWCVVCATRRDIAACPTSKLTWFCQNSWSSTDEQHRGKDDSAKHFSICFFCTLGQRCWPLWPRVSQRRLGCNRWYFTKSLAETWSILSFTSAEMCGMHCLPSLQIGFFDQSKSGCFSPWGSEWQKTSLRKMPLASEVQPFSFSVEDTCSCARASCALKPLSTHRLCVKWQSSCLCQCRSIRCPPETCSKHDRFFQHFDEFYRIGCLLSRSGLLLQLTKVVSLARPHSYRVFFEQVL